MPVRNYSNIATPRTLTQAVSDTATTLTVASTTGYPVAPFLLALERGVAGKEEIVLCTAMTATTFTVQRGYDGTTAVAHGSGAALEHTVAAVDYREANLVANLLSAKGDLLGHNGTGIGRVQVGLDTQVPVADSTTQFGWQWRYLYTPALHTWAVGGAIQVPSGEAGVIPPMHIWLGVGYPAASALLIGVAYRCNNGAAGVTVSFKMQVNGADVAGLGTTAAPLVTPAAATWGRTQPQNALILTDGDSLAPVVTAITGTPQNFSVTALIQYKD